MTDAPPELLFYDGHCGLCHRSVRFLLRRDPGGRAFRFAPLQGRTFQDAVSPDRRAGLPDSMVLKTVDGRLLLKSDAWLHILRRLGRGWRVLAAVCAIVPRPVRDWCYDFIAAVRLRVFGRRDQLCPVVPPELRGRFDP